MNTVKVHQLLHGYRGGHGRIAGSVKLTERDSEIVTRLSDLSGSLSSGLQLEPYLTVYPLPSRRFYALARTWADPEAPRAGCVLTHTILVPVDSWATLVNVRSVNKLFHNLRLTPDFNFDEPIELSSGSEDPWPSEAGIDSKVTTTFVSRYFGQGVRPIVWFNTIDAEEYLWRLLEHLWPNLRSVYSCCTYALQQRALEDGPFDLLFAPSSVRSRFLKLTPEHFIETASGRKDTQVTVEPWCEYWAQALFSTKRGLPSGESELPIWSELGEDPTAVRKLSLIQELRNRAIHSPTAGVGAMDVIESLAHEPNAGLPLKRLILAGAIEAAVAATPGGDGLTSLRLIDDRLRRDAFRNLADDFNERLSTAAAQVTARDPIAAVEAGGTWLADSMAGTRSAFVQGVVLGLRNVANSDPSRLAILRSHPDIAAEIFRLEPTFAATYLQIGGEGAPRALAGWLSSTRDAETLRLVRKSVLPVLQRADDEELLSPLLRDLRGSDVNETLDVLSKISDGFSGQTIRKVVSEQICSAYPERTREWASTGSHWSTGVSAIVAATYPSSKHGFNELLQRSSLTQRQHAQVIAAMVCAQMSGGSPYWLREMLSTDVRLVGALLRAGPNGEETIETALSLIVNEVSELPLAASGEVLTAVLAFEGRPMFPQLLEAAMRSLIGSYLIDGKETPETRKFASDVNATSWLQNVAGSKLSKVLVHGCHSGPQAISRAWKWIADAPTALYQRRPGILPELCEELLRYSRQPFPEGAEHSLVRILSRSRSEAESHVRKGLSTIMLRFALDNVSSPLGGVVAEAFTDVYEAATEQDSRSSSLFSVLFGSYGWDRGKDVRISVIDAFMRSNWAPGDLAIASENAGILRKIFKRLHRKPKGDEYINTMLRDLSQRRDIPSSKVREHLQSLSSAPNFYEEWD